MSRWGLSRCVLSLKSTLLGGKTEKGRKNRVNSESLGTFWVCSVLKVEEIQKKEGRRNSVKNESLWTVCVCSVSNVEEVQRKDWSNSVNSESLVNFLGVFCK